MKERSAATITAIAANQKAPGAGYGCNPLTRSPALGSQLVAHLQGLGITNAAQEIQRHRVQIERFDVPSSIPQTRWERLTRMLDGKAALKYLSACTPTRFDAHHGFLAERMRYAGRIPAEIRGYIEEFQAAVV